MIVLDTHAWIWWISNPEKLSSPAKKAINKAVKGKNIYISSISAWEAALLHINKRLELSIDFDEWLAKTEKLPFLSFIPIDNRIVIKSVSLSEPLHRDPADRIIISTAITLGAALVTKDDKIINYPHVETIW
ncbi:MAG: type II toxin-antitoxin system VapC family toxin [Deltaproteobacteria bacterium]|nr:type II toxin-antitoxin system VapC family toxin [Deltaproteobacteria bacterium]